MPGDKDRFIEVLSNEKNEIEELKKIVEDKSNLSIEIKKIRMELKTIEDTFKPMDNMFSNRLKKIKDLNDEVKLLNLDVQSGQINVITHIINSNLPSGFYVKDKIDSEEKNSENNLKDMELWYFSKDDIYLKKDKDIKIKVGNIDISKTEELQFKVEVILENRKDVSVKKAEFTIPDLYRVHKIIEWINLNLHYNE